MCIDQSLLIGVSWKPIVTALAKLKFGADGIYYLNSNNKGTYTINCSSVSIQRTGQTLEFEIIEVTATTLQLKTYPFGTLDYIKESNT